MIHVAVLLCIYSSKTSSRIKQPNSIIAPPTPVLVFPSGYFARPIDLLYIVRYTQTAHTACRINIILLTKKPLSKKKEERKNPLIYHGQRNCTIDPILGKPDLAQLRIVKLNVLEYKDKVEKIKTT